MEDCRLERAEALDLLRDSAWCRLPDDLFVDGDDERGASSRWGDPGGHDVHGWCRELLGQFPSWRPWLEAGRLGTPRGRAPAT